MWEFAMRQKELRIGRFGVGGRLGENPTVLIGSIFYQKQKCLGFNDADGSFDREECEKLVKVQDEFSDKTGLPCMLDVVLQSERWMARVVDFVASVTDVPILLDAVSTSIRLAALDYMEKAGLRSRCVYNSFSPESKKVEFDKAKETGLEAAVLLAYNRTDMTSKGRVAAIKQLSLQATESGVTKALADACVLDVPTLGTAFKTIFDVKNCLGIPAGCGAHNAIATWRGLKTKMGREAFKPCTATANTLTMAAGADFILYGPVEGAPYVFPAAAMVDAAFGQLLIEEGRVPPSSHPIFKIA
jgi:tetrahydromethanopterin S-methyltransferase subunit H